jgi:signal recognition particle receptor subunit beta
MVLFNYSTKELTAKVVYYGPGLCGKTTNLQWIHEKLPIKNKGKMLSLATETDRTLFFDFLPIELGTIRGMKTRIQLYTVPGQVFYNATRRMVLKGADCVVFVCDSQEAMLDANIESMDNLRENLEVNEIDPDEVPMALQYNKRDLPNALPIEILNEKLNMRGLQFYEAIALKGIGVEETLKGVTSLVFRSLANKYGGEVPAERPAGAAHSTAPVVPAPAPPTPTPTPPPPAPVPKVEAPAPQPALKTGATTLPPLNLEPRPASGEDLLDSLELQAAPEEAVEELSLEEEAPPPAEEEISVPEEEIEALDLGEPEPARRNAKETLVSPPDEAAELRRRIGGPRVASMHEELNLDEINDEEAVEEVSFEEPPPAPAPRSPGLEEFSVDVSEVETEAAPSPPPPPAPAPALPAPPPSAITTPPVAVRVSAEGSGEADVSIPLEVMLDSGTARVDVHLRLTLSLKPAK